MRIKPLGSSWWPQDAVDLAPEKIAEMYGNGFVGAWSDPEAKGELRQQIGSAGGIVDAEDACTAFGLAGLGEGKLSLLFPTADKVFQGCMPGPAQQRGDCVSHGTKNAALMTLAVEIFNARPDEVTGLVEGTPELPTAGIQQGVLSTEYIYWWRGYNGDGWSCPTAASKVLKHGIMLRKPYTDLGIDLTSYSGGLAGKYGSQSPPSNIESAGKEHLIRTATDASGKMEAIRDLIAGGYGVVHCGGEGWSNRRDENGFSNRSGSWSHAMSYIGYDDRDEIKQKYGEPLILILNSWGSSWIGGGRTILGTNIQIPEGSFWAKVSACRSRDATAFSGVNGWPRKKLVDLGATGRV